MRALNEIIAVNIDIPLWARDRPVNRPNEPWTVQSLAAAWRSGAHEPDSEGWLAYVAALPALKPPRQLVTTRFPYISADFMREEVINGFKMFVVDDANVVFAPNHPLAATWHNDISFNGLSRAVHDWLGHILVENSFSFLGEYGAFLDSRKYFPRETWDVLFAEVVGQAAYHAVYGTFPPVQKCVTLDHTRGLTL